MGNGLRLVEMLNFLRAKVKSSGRQAPRCHFGATSAALRCAKRTPRKPALLRGGSDVITLGLRLGLWVVSNHPPS